MGSFRRVFGIVCFVYAAVALLWFFNLIQVDAKVVVAGFLVIIAVSFVIDALVARQGRERSEGGAND